MYVACQSTDDIPSVLDCVGEENIVIGTDYGHTDTSSELDAILILQAQTDIDRETKDRILHYNPKALYDL